MSEGAQYYVDEDGYKYPFSVMVKRYKAHDQLVEALEACLLRLDHHDAQSAPEALQARAAIAKAKGEA